MHLVQNDFCNTLGEAAQLINVSEAVLKEDAFQNIRGGAALLAKYAGGEVFESDDIEGWFEACKRFSGLSNDTFQNMQASTYFNTLRSGNQSQTVWGESIIIQAKPSLSIPQNANTSGDLQSSTSDYPPALGQFTSCNFTAGRTSSIDTWVNHWIGVGTYAGAISWFQNCYAGASAHFVIRSSDGEITQVVAVANTAWHAGASGYNNNQRSIGVEHEATLSNPELWNSIPMLAASATMACFFTDQYNIPPVRALPGIREHNEMPGTSTSCAGNIPWADWMDIYNPCVGVSSSLDCSNAVPVSCGVSYSGPASSEVSNVSTYGCNSWTETGPERVHTVVSPGSGTLNAYVSNYTGDLDVYILESCDPNDCVGTVGSDSATYTDAIAGQTYYIVVDADDGSGSSYDLLVTCPTGSPTGLDCTNAIQLTCDQIYSGSASSAISEVDAYACNSWTETGPERVHTIVAPANGELTAQLSNYTGDLDVYILNSCDPDDCIGTVNSDSASISNAVAGQTYYIVVDADDGSGSAYDILVTCPEVPQEGLDCSNAIALSCGVTYSGAASSDDSFVDVYSCNSWTETGPERVHTIVPSYDGTITAQLSNYTGDLDVYILGSCDPDDCLGTVGSDSATFTNAVAGQTYYIIVDADDGSGSAYDIVVTCPPPPALDCSNNIALTCGQTYTGAASNAISNIELYGCNIFALTGPERVHTIVPSYDGTLTASISNFTGDLDVYILGSCDAMDCLAVGDNVASYANGVSGQTYYIVIDSYNGSGSGYDLVVDCPPPPGLDCSNAIALTCGVTYSGAASTDDSYVDSYACNSWTETGPERVHTIVPSLNGTITAQLSNYTGDLDVYILGSCDPADCLGSVGSESATFVNAIAGQTYYIVIDADDGSGSAYDLIVNCPSNICQDDIIIDGTYSANETHKANFTINSAGTIVSGADVNIHAGESIQLNNGFTIEAGAEVDIYIEDCE